MSGVLRFMSHASHSMCGCASCFRAYREEEALSQQPSAEAQGGGEASEGWHAALDSASELVSNAPDARYRKRAEQVRDWIKAHPAAPPSAPVGVERLVGSWRARAETETSESKNKEWAEWVRENHRGAASAFDICAWDLDHALARCRGGES